MKVGDYAVTHQGWRVRIELLCPPDEVSGDQSNWLVRVAYIKDRPDSLLPNVGYYRMKLLRTDADLHQEAIAILGEDYFL